MTVTFGTPSAEHVTMTAGMPFSSTGRISAGRRRHRQVSAPPAEPAARRHRTGRLQKDLAHLELHGHGRRLDGGLQQIFRRIGEDVTEAFQEPVPNAVGDLDVLALHGPVTQVLSLELIGLVRRELLDGQRELAVVLERLDEVCREVLRDQRRQRPAIRADAPSRHAMTERHEFVIPRPGEREIRVLFRNLTIRPGIVIVLILCALRRTGPRYTAFDARLLGRRTHVKFL